MDETTIAALTIVPILALAALFGWLTHVLQKDVERLLDVMRQRAEDDDSE